MRSRSEQSALEHLNKIAKSDDARAIEYLRYAMANRYRNFFAIDEKDAALPPADITKKVIGIKNDMI